MILDDPFIDLEDDQKPALLEMAAKASRHQQIIYLTDDETVASWGRVEALTGEVAVIEPTGDEGDTKPHPRRSRRHVAA